MTIRAFVAGRSPGTPRQPPPLAPGAGLVRVTTIADLALIPGAATWVWVESVLCFWEWVPSSTLAPDGITVVACADGGNWERCVPSTAQDWLSQATWGIDPGVGNDENVGTPAFPLRNAAELNRRLSVGAILQNTTVTIPAGVTIAEIDLEIDPGAFLFEITGTPTTVYSGTIATYTDRVHATPESALLTDAAIADWTPYLKMRLRVTGGAATGAISWVVLANPHGLGLNVARVGRFCLAPTGALPSNPVVPAALSAYVIETLPIVQKLSLHQRTPHASGNNLGLAFAVRNLCVRSSSVSSPGFRIECMAPPRALEVDGCIVDTQVVLPSDANIQHHLFSRCLFGGTLVAANLLFTGGSPYLAGSVSFASVAFTSGFTARVRDHLHQGSQSFLFQAVAHTLCSLVYWQDVQIFDTTVRALDMQNFCVWNSLGGLSGDGNPIGLEIGDDDNESITPQFFTWCQTADAPNLRGTTTDVRINAATGDINLSWATIVAEGGFASDAQWGVGTLVNGTATITARNGNIRPPQVTRDTVNGTPIGILAVPAATRTATQFVVNSLSEAAGAVVATDQSTFRWEIPPMRRTVVVCQGNAKT